mmetsp:Transcript_4592/g.14412  ORF Transcript_4592/g.14412 Transcript_4592/m.14412 type:complete len:278 (+) Transcript_4592:188-1021(+)
MTPSSPHLPERCGRTWRPGSCGCGRSAMRRPPSLPSASWTPGSARPSATGSGRGLRSAAPAISSRWPTRLRAPVPLGRRMGGSSRPSCPMSSRVSIGGSSAAATRAACSTPSPRPEPSATGSQAPWQTRWTARPTRWTARTWPSWCPASARPPSRGRSSWESSPPARRGWSGRSRPDSSPAWRAASGTPTRGARCCGRPLAASRSRAPPRSPRRTCCGCSRASTQPAGRRRMCCAPSGASPPRRSRSTLQRSPWPSCASGRAWRRRCGASSSSCRRS